MSGLPAPETFLSGEHGEVGGKRGSLRRAGDRALDRWLAMSGKLRRIDALATPRRDILVAGIYRHPNAPPQPPSENHDVRLAVGEMVAGVGKFERLNTLIGDARADWLVVIDDDVELPPRFLDRFVAVCEERRFDLAQPAQTLASHAAWRVVRRKPFALARNTPFVEIGPVTAFSRRAQDELLPFPALRYGWGLDLHWAALARERSWRLGIVDALAVRHETAPVGAAYSADAAIEEAQRFLADRAYLPSSEVGG
jgi:glycosyl transferase family 2